MTSGGSTRCTAGAQSALTADAATAVLTADEVAVETVVAQANDTTVRVANDRARYQHRVILIDVVAAVLGVAIGMFDRFGFTSDAASVGHLGLALALPLLWLACNGVNRAYEPRFLGAGTIEFERVGRAFLHLVALTAFTAYVTKADLSRGFVLVALPTTALLSVCGRYAARKMLHRRRKQGAAMAPVIAVGSLTEILEFNQTLQVNDYAGLQVTVACITGDEVDELGRALLAEHGIVQLGDIDSIRDAVVRSGARSVAVVSRDLSGEKLRWISWQLEGTSTDLVLLPGLTEVAGRRLNMQQVGGLPLVYVAEPEFRGMRRIVKSVFDRSAAALALVLLAPIMITIAVLVRVTSRGPALFLQTRIGKDGKAFRMMKFRSMCDGAERQLDALRDSNDFAGGTLFKLREDPRITPIGKVLRRFSLDELPQLFNVLLGSMSLVGPRPPLPVEVESYGVGAVHRRLLVKPGITGLWQISGRSDLTWEESIRLDLRYVDSWTLTLDLIVLLKTASAVVRSRGAY